MVFSTPAFDDRRLLRPQFDALIHDSVAADDEAAFFAYEDYAAREQPVNILPQGSFPLLVANRLDGVERFVNAEGYWAPEELWVRNAECGAATDNARP